MRDRDLDALGFAAVCRRTADFAVSDMGVERSLALRPLASRAEADHALDQTRDFLRLVETHGNPPLVAFPDVRDDLSRASLSGFALDGEALVEVRAVLECLRRCSAFFRKCDGDLGVLADLARDLPQFGALEQSLRRALDHDGTVLDEASDDLAALRASIRKLRDTLTRKLGEVVNRRGMADVVADQYVTLRNDRFVIPIKAGATGRIQGVVQDRSVSGETFFVEPLFAVELNNQLLNAVRDEEAMVRRILGELTALVGREGDAIAGAVDRLAEIDCIAARAHFAAEYRCTRPTFSDGAIDLRDARHPGLSFTGRPVTPIDLLLPEGKRTLVITGPNTGGKTVALKTLGLAALMARSGMLIPAAAGARLPFFREVFTDVGDEQSIERDLSTYSAHVVNLREILAAAGAGSLILLDEPGVGTDPEEGAALAVGLLEYLERRPVHAAVTTHYRAVKVHALRSDACSACAVDFDVDLLEPRYRLLYDSLGRSLALPIAARLGLATEVLEGARRAQSDDTRTFNDVLERLDGARRELETARAKCDAGAAALAEQMAEVRAREAEAAKLVTDLRERRQRAWKEELREAREFVRTLKDKGRAQLRELNTAPAARGAFTRFVREQERQIAERGSPTPHPPEPAGVAPAASPPQRPTAGDTVEVGSRGVRGELLSIDGERAWVQSGTMRFEVATAELRRVGRKTKASAEVRVRRSVAEVEREVILVGLRARQALEKLEGFLDRAAQSDQDSVRIIHGVGSGALQRAVREYLSTSPYCSGFREGEAGEGGPGVTVATLGG
jgi:DNA mismatch repair protein MutS2